MDKPPAVVGPLLKEAEALGFRLSSEPLTGSLLRTLAATKPGGRFLELGTGVGMGTAWLLDGMTADATLLTVDADPRVQEVARRRLGADARVRFQLGDAAALLGQLAAASFDLIFADAWPGKFSHMDEALRLLRVGGVYVVDDLLPQPSWPEGHAAKVEQFLRELCAREDLTLTQLDWSTGIVISVRR